MFRDVQAENDLMYVVKPVLVMTRTVASLVPRIFLYHAHRGEPGNEARL